VVGAAKDTKGTDGTKRSDMAGYNMHPSSGCGIGHDFIRGTTSVTGAVAMAGTSSGDDGLTRVAPDT